jgi:hypothetical protein
MASRSRSGIQARTSSSAISRAFWRTGERELQRQGRSRIPGRASSWHAASFDALNAVLEERCHARQADAQIKKPSLAFVGAAYLNMYDRQHLCYNNT